MKKGIRKMLSAIACAALAMGCLAGCGSNTNSSVANTTTESAAENTSTAAAETASDSTAADGKVYQIRRCIGKAARRKSCCIQCSERPG